MRFITSCPVGCKSKLVKSKYTVSEVSLLQCSECGQLISSCSPEEYFESMKEFNNPKGTSPNSNSIKRALDVHKKRLIKIEKITGKDRSNIKLLDIGCSSGSFLENAKTFGFKYITGVEPAKKAASTAIKRGLNVKIGTLEDVKFPSESFDAITLFEVIEHLKYPTKLLDECRRILKKNGIIVIGTGNAHSLMTIIQKDNREYFDIKAHGGHISFFNPSSMKILANRCGFKVESVKTSGLSFANKKDTPKAIYSILKILSEALKPTVSVFQMGHDMMAFLRKNSP